jgi:translocation and assembly module TamA
MKAWRQRGILAGLTIGSAMLVAAPTASFEIFGIHLWGQAADDDRIEIIDPLPYTVTFQVSGGSSDTKRALEAASALWGGREAPASGKGGLLARARGDYRRLLAALYDEGFYGPYISIRAAGREVADLTLNDPLPPEVPVAIQVDPGPRFRFGRADIVNGPPTPPDDPETPAALGFESGQRANAGAVNAASALAVEQWRQLARAKAREADREIIADHTTNRLDATLTMDPGPYVRFGRVSVESRGRTDPAFVAYMVDIQEGDSFDPDEVDAARQRLARLGIFSSIRIEEAETLGANGSMPLTVRVQDRRPRTIGFGGTLSTIDGVGVQAYWMHRNLFGRAERLRFDASIDGLGESTSPDYNLGVAFTKPGVLNPDTSLVVAAVARQLDFDTYRERSVTGRVGLSRMFGDYLTGDLFAVASRARYEDDFGIRHFTTFGLTASAIYDRRNDPLDATSGYYVAADVAPFYEAVYGNPALRTTLEGRAYYPINTDARYVLAGRAKIGSYFGPSAAESPPDQLFFTGGGGSVRGYAYRSIGISVDDLNGEPAVIGGNQNRFVQFGFGLARRFFRFVVFEIESNGLSKIVGFALERDGLQTGDGKETERQNQNQQEVDRKRRYKRRIRSPKIS